MKLKYFFKKSRRNIKKPTFRRRIQLYVQLKKNTRSKLKMQSETVMRQNSFKIGENFSG